MANGGAGMWLNPVPTEILRLKITVFGARSSTAAKNLKTVELVTSATTYPAPFSTNPEDPLSMT
jgi:hypothetical protein